MVLLWLVVILVIIGAPLAVVWALNTLFPLYIAYDFWSWLAVVILCVIFNAPRYRE